MSSLLFLIRKYQAVGTKAFRSRIVEPDGFRIRLLGLVKRFNNFLPRHGGNLRLHAVLRNSFSLCGFAPLREAFAIL